MVVDEDMEVDEEDDAEDSAGEMLGEEADEEACLFFRLFDGADLTITPCSRIFSMIFFFLFCEADEREDSDCSNDVE